MMPGNVTPSAVSAAPPEERPTPLHWRQFLLALLPLALAGIVPLWACLLLCLVTGLGLRDRKSVV